jgi:hypothetical protein
MSSDYPTPEEVGIKIPKQLREDWFNQGFEHALKGHNLSCPVHLKRSFMEGYRAAKLYLRELRKRQGIVGFPIQGRCKWKVA